MKKLSYTLMIFGACALLYGLLMDTSVNTGYGESVHNISLGNTRTAIILFGGFIFLGGIGIFAISKQNQSQEDRRAERTQIENMKNRINSEEGRHNIYNILLMSLIYLIVAVLVYILYVFLFMPIINNPISPWMIIITSIILIFVVFAKRRLFS